MSWVPRRRQTANHLVRDAGDADGVALLYGEVAEGSCQLAGEFDLGDASRSESHRAAGVENETAPQVGVGLELLHVKAIRPAEDTPVEPPQIVTGNIFAIFGEFDARSAMR